MRKNQIKGLMNDLLDLGIYEHPLEHFSNIDNLEADLFKMKINYLEEDSVYDFYKKKMAWFQDRIKKLGSFDDFQSAKIIVADHKEKIEITFKNEKFSKERIFVEAELPEWIIKNAKLKQSIKNLKPCADVSKKE